VIVDRDKRLHFWAGLLIALLVGLIFNAAIGMTAAVVAGVLKEAYDATGRGTADSGDVIATVIGGIFGCAALIIIAGVLP
jgi:hypothetical protein